MSYIFISDLHLGDGSRMDDFYRKDDLLRLLNYVEENNYKLIIVGDLFELWQTDLDGILFHHDIIIKQLLKLFRGGKLVYLIGNHDHIPFVKYLESGFNAQIEFEDTSEGIWAEHGNQYDIFNKYKDPRMAVRNKLGRAVAYSFGWLERILHPNIDEWARKALLEEGGLFLKTAAQLKNMLSPLSCEYKKRGGNLSEYENAAENIINSGKKIVIFGHTHQPMLKRLGSGIYANCGSWCGKNDIPTYVKYDAKRVELRSMPEHSLINSVIV